MITISSCFFTLFFSYLLARFYLSGISISGQKILFFAISFLILVYLFKKMNWKISLQFPVIWCLFGWFCIFLLAFSFPIVHSTYDFSYAINIVKLLPQFLIFSIFPLYCLVTAIDSHDVDAVEVYINLYSKFILLYVMFTCLCICFPPVREIWFTMIDFGPSPHTQEILENLSEGAYASRIGWNGWAGGGASFDCSLCILMNLWLIEKYVGGKNNKKSWFVILVSLVGNLLYARTGLCCSVLMLTVYFTWKSFSKNILWLLYGIGGVLSVILMVAFLKDYNEQIGYVHVWALEPFVNFVGGEEFYTGSTDILVNRMYWMPDFDALLYGHGWYEPMPDMRYMTTDPGIMRGIYFWGLVPTLLSYSLTIYAIRNTFLGKGIFFLLSLILFIAHEAKDTIWLHYFVLAVMMMIVYDENNVSGGS